MGSLLVRRLLERGYPVRVFDRLVYGDFALKELKNKIELVKGDVRQPPRDLMKGVFAVIHLAGLSTEPTAYYSPRNTDLINHLGTEKLARLAKEAGVARFVFASTASIYFTYNTPLTPPLYTEKEKVNPISPYSLTKHAAEEALLELTDRNFQPIIFRKGTIYGFSPKMRYDLVVNSFVKDSFTKKTLTVHAGGEIYRPMLDIEEAAAAYITALELPLKKIGGRIFNVASSNWQVGKLAEKTAAILRRSVKKEFKIEILPVGVARNYLMDCSQFERSFGSMNNRSFADAVLEIWQKLQAGHNFADRRYYTDLWHKKFV